MNKRFIILFFNKCVNFFKYIIEFLLLFILINNMYGVLEFKIILKFFCCNDFIVFD